MATETSRYLCQNLKLTIILEPNEFDRSIDQIRVQLQGDSTQVEQCYPINQTKPPSRRYHVREAMVLSVRRLLCEGIRLGLISDYPGGSTSLTVGPIAAAASKPMEFTIGPEFSEPSL